MPEPAIGVMSGTPNTGLENSAVFIRDVDPTLYFYETDKHPIASMILTNGMELARRENSALPKITGKALKKQKSGNVKVEFLEDDTWLKREYNPTAAVTTSATSVTISSSDDDHFRAGDTLLLTNASGQREYLYVSSVAANTLNVANADGTTRTAGIAMTTSDKLYKMGNVRAEDSTAPAIRTTQRGDVYNYLSIMSETYGLTRTKRAQSDYNGDPFMLEKRKAFSRFMIQLEQNFWFGVRDVSASTTNPIYHSGGFHYFLELYSDVESRDMAGSPLTRAELNSFLNSVMRGGSTKKCLVGGKNALGVIDGLGYENVRVKDYRVGELGILFC